MGRFHIVLADPPWRTEFGETCSRAVERHYRTMTPDAIAKVPCPARDEALLLLWATSFALPAALGVMTA
jgi:hypothetical protein